MLVANWKIVYQHWILSIFCVFSVITNLKLFPTNSFPCLSLSLSCCTSLASEGTSRCLIHYTFVIWLWIYIYFTGLRLYTKYIVCLSFVCVLKTTHGSTVDHRYYITYAKYIYIYIYIDPLPNYIRYNRPQSPSIYCPLSPLPLNFCV